MGHDVSGLNLIPVFMTGLLGSVHCIGMCGGIVSAFTAASPTRRILPIAVVTDAGTLAQDAAFDNATRVIAWNGGRIASYMIAGAIAGGIAGSARMLANLSSLQIGGYWLANLMLVALGLYLMNAWRGLTRIEAAGRLVWRRIQPLTKYFLPVDSPIKALALGGLWGWVPCGMVYSVLLTAMLTGSALSGATVMLAFGLGTLPTVLAIGMFGVRVKILARHRALRIASGLIVLAFGVLGLVRAANGLSLGWLDAICVSPPAAGAQR
jgi:sulfite exporter TauE/SafE